MSPQKPLRAVFSDTPINGSAMSLNGRDSRLGGRCKPIIKLCYIRDTLRFIIGKIQRSHESDHLQPIIQLVKISADSPVNDMDVMEILLFDLPVLPRSHNADTAIGILNSYPPGLRRDQGSLQP